MHTRETAKAMKEQRWDQVGEQRPQIKCEWGEADALTYSQIC